MQADAAQAPPGKATLSQRTRTFLAGSGQIAVAMMVLNLGTYGYTALTARVIGRDQYGAFFAMMNLMLIVGVVSLGLQATAARRISADPTHVDYIEHRVVRVSIGAAASLALVLWLGAPVIKAALHLDSMATALLAGAAAIPLTIMGGQAGILQGERRWRELAVFYVVSGVPRFAIGLALILWRPTEFMAFLGATIGYVVPCLYATWALRRNRRNALEQSGARRSGLVRESIVNSQALLAFFALTNADMIVARMVLDRHDSGLYAGGLIVARAVLFLPQFVVVVAFPSLSTTDSRAQALARSVTAVAVLGGLCTAATALLPDLVLIFAGGEEFTAARGHLWVFAMLGTVMALLHLLIYSVLARQGLLSVILVWVALVVLVVTGLSATDLTSLLTSVLAVQGCLMLCLALVSYVRFRKDPAPVPQ